jgi:hypothetical protein
MNDVFGKERIKFHVSPRNPASEGLVSQRKERFIQTQGFLDLQ